MKTRTELWRSYRQEIEQNAHLQAAVRRADERLTILTRRLLKVYPDYASKFPSHALRFQAPAGEESAPPAFDLAPLEALITTLHLAPQESAFTPGRTQLDFSTPELAPLKARLAKLRADDLDYVAIKRTATVPIAPLKLVKLKPSMRALRIAIDGPSGSGKSTVARLLAKRLGLNYINTGLIYRALAYAVLQNDINYSDPAALTAFLAPLEIKLEKDEVVKLNGHDITRAVRGDDVSQTASRLAALPAVRAYALKIARAYAQHPGVVMDGRDTTFNIMPNADLKIFLDTAPEVRARRRVEQNRTLGFNTDYAQILAEIKERDERDRTRATDPLHQVPGAHLIDASAMSIEAVLAAIEALIPPVAH